MAAMTIREYPAILLPALGCAVLLILPAAAKAGTLTPSPSPLEFRSVPVGTTEVEAVTFANTESTTTIAAVSLEEEEPTGQFAIEPGGENGCEPGELPAGESCVVEVAFHPTAAGEMKATLVVESDAMTDPLEVELIGLTAPEFAISPFTFDFGSVKTGSKSAAKHISVENRGFDTGVIDAITLSGAGADQFEITANECTEGLEPGGSCGFAVLFAPTSAGSRSASVEVTSNAPESPQVLTVSGTGVSPSPPPPLPPPPALAVAPAKPSNAFGLGKVIRNRRRGTAILPIHVPGPGSVLLRGKGLIARKGPGSALVLGGAGTARLAIVPTGRKERSLIRTGRAKIVARVTYLPAGGDPLMKTKKIRLVKRHR
jgi:hypothetical protein